ncbi:MAG: hypothetical protein ABI818_10590 [Acidobacteriota bacterium]
MCGFAQTASHAGAALTNIGKHARAREASLRLERSGARLRLTIADEGAGFALRGARRRGFGLLGIEDRSATGARPRDDLQRSGAGDRGDGHRPADGGPGASTGDERGQQPPSISGTHEPGSSHYDLLSASADEATLRSMRAALEASGYPRTSSATRSGWRMAPNPSG